MDGFGRIRDPTRFARRDSRGNRALREGSGSRQASIDETRGGRRRGEGAPSSSSSSHAARGLRQDRALRGGRRHQGRARARRRVKEARRQGGAEVVEVDEFRDTRAVPAAGECRQLDRFPAEIFASRLPTVPTCAPRRRRKSHGARRTRQDRARRKDRRRRALREVAHVKKEDVGKNFARREGHLPAEAIRKTSTSRRRLSEAIRSSSHRPAEARLNVRRSIRRRSIGRRSF